MCFRKPAAFSVCFVSVVGGGGGPRDNYEWFDKDFEHSESWLGKLWPVWEILMNIGLVCTQ